MDLLESPEIGESQDNLAALALLVKLDDLAPLVMTDFLAKEETLDLVDPQDQSDPWVTKEREECPASQELPESLDPPENKDPRENLERLVPRVRMETEERLAPPEFRDHKDHLEMLELLETEAPRDLKVLLAVLERREVEVALVSPVPPDLLGPQATSVRPALLDPVEREAKEVTKEVLAPLEGQELLDHLESKDPLENPVVVVKMDPRETRDGRVALELWDFLDLREALENKECPDHQALTDQWEPQDSVDLQDVTENLDQWDAKALTALVDHLERRDQWDLKVYQEGRDHLDNKEPTLKPEELEDMARAHLAMPITHSTISQ